MSFFRLHRGMEVLLERSCCYGGMVVYRSITYRFFASLFFLQCVLCSTLKMRHLTSATVRTTWIGYLCCYVPATLLLRPSNIAAAHILGLHNRIATTIKKLNRQKLMQNFNFYLIFNFAFILRCSQPTLSLAHIRKFGTKGLK